MPVVINEFEVVPGEARSSQTGESSTSGKSEGKTAPSAHQIELLVEQQLERCERVRAH
jgi:hypothetical protein